MGATGKITDYVVDIGVNAIKGKIKSTQEASQVRRKLNDFLDRQRKYNLNCTLEEEIDFQGISEYICGDLAEDVERRLFGNAIERGRARQSIMDKAAHYAQAKTCISEGRSKQLVSAAIDILRLFYREKINRELKFIAAEIEDAVTGEMTAQHQSLEKKIEEMSILSIDRNISLLQAGNIDLVEQNLSIFLKGISAAHTLPRDFKFSLNERGRMISIPIADDALKRYPPRLKVSAESIKMGDTVFTKFDNQILSQAYRHQLPISFDVAAAKKYLGDILDPAQSEAEEVIGAHFVLYPPQFSKAFPCNVSIDGNVAVEYLLLRTREILDDGTRIITNDEQENFNFRIQIRINQELNQASFSVAPTNPTNYESLQYRLFLKKASAAEEITVKALEKNAKIFSVGKLNPIDFVKLDSEIDFLEKVVAIERSFGVPLCIPQELRPEDHFLIHRLYSMIEHGAFQSKRKHFDFALEVSELFRSSINNMVEDATLSLAYTEDVSVTLFGQTLEFPLLRRIDGAKIDDLAELKRKVVNLNNGDNIRLRYVPADPDGFMAYSDAFFSEDAQQKLLYPDAEQPVD